MELDTIDELTTVNLENREHIYLSKYPFYTTTRGGIHFIGASPSHGKTQILLNLMFEIANMRTSEGIPAYNCLFVSLEMSKASIKERYIKLDPEN
jgi:predicted ATP-dependent serine protease